MLTNAANDWPAICHARQDIYAHITWKNADLLLGKCGTITCRARADGSGYSLQHMPNQVGFLRDHDGSMGNSKLRLDAKAIHAAQAERVKIVIQRHFNASNDAILIVRDGDDIKFASPLARLHDGEIIEVQVGKAANDLIVEVCSPTSEGAIEIGGIHLR